MYEPIFFNSIMHCNLHIDILQQYCIRLVRLTAKIPSKFCNTGCLGWEQTNGTVVPPCKKPVMQKVFTCNNIIIKWNQTPWHIHICCHRYMIIQTLCNLVISYYCFHYISKSLKGNLHTKIMENKILFKSPKINSTWLGLFDTPDGVPCVSSFSLTMWVSSSYKTFVK